MDDVDAFVPVSVEDARSRTLAVAHFLARLLYLPPPSMLDEIRRESTDEEWQSILQGSAEATKYFCNGLTKHGLWDALTPSERETMRTDLLHISMRMFIDASWLAESFTVLMWALDQLEALPPYDTQSAGLELAEDVAENVRKLANASFRPEAEINHARNIAEVWHWRSRTRQLLEEGRTDICPPGRTFDAIVRSCAATLQSDGEFQAIDDDFPVFGTSYRAMSDAQWSQVRSITMERHRALNWLCGFAPENKWEETPTDT
ncbi:MAG: DUF4272 domain-containing protein [Armatimonadetes bacterium]|nr:DUF4272 domain-containing protein [Armatimonadota bacterium]